MKYELRFCVEESTVPCNVGVNTVIDACTVKETSVVAKENPFALYTWLQGWREIKSFTGLQCNVYHVRPIHEHNALLYKKM